MTRQLKRSFEPKQERAQKTVEYILKAAADLLDEVGFERLSTNMICKKAKLTPPALYRYFPNKYAILTKLGERLMEDQNAALTPFIAKMATDLDDTNIIVMLLREQLAVTKRTPGGRWIMRALHATPALCDVRTNSHNQVANEFSDAMLKIHPNLDRHSLRRTMRLNIEIGYCMLEYLLDVPSPDSEKILQETAALLSHNIKRNLH